MTFLLAPVWLKWSFAPAPFTRFYVLGFVITASMLVTIGLWIVSGFAGWQRLFQTQWHTAWLVFLALLNIWGFLSQFWSFGLAQYPGMAQTAFLQLLVVSLFACVLISTPDVRQSIIFALVISMLVHGTIGQLQVFFQSDIGLGWLGEFTLSPEQSGISVLEANGERWLRPHGLLPHPNILAGIIILGLFASAEWILQQGKKQVLGTIAFMIGFWFLLLTFSRGAWLGFTGGVLFALPFVIRRQNFFRRIVPGFTGTVIIGCLFVAMYSPLLISRAGIGQQNTELRSISDRVVYNKIAWDAIQKYPVQGIGLGNYPWYASNYLFYQTDYDLNGDNVHNIYLGILAELGLVGFVLFMGMVIAGIGATLQQRQIETIALLAGFVALTITGLVDHYMWTLVFTQTLWLGILGASMAGVPDETLLLED